MISRYRGKAKALFTFIDLLEKNTERRNVWLIFDDLSKLWADFQSIFKRIKAAGGIVVQPDGKWMFIQRRGYLDLPKGKLDTGENEREAAVREVREETGIIASIYGTQSWSTWHIYRENKTRFLKETTWFLMQSQSYAGLPQLEEGITAIHWMTPEQYLVSTEVKYRNLTDLVSELKEVVIS